MEDRIETKSEIQSAGNAKADNGNAKAGNGERDRGLLRVDQNECKGCGLCAEACPPKVIRLSEQLNHYGYRPASYAGSGCTGCGICFLVCPEPGAITVMRLIKAGEGQAGAVRTGAGRAGAVRTGSAAIGSVARAS
jgi:NAD-dependent dihydropyrimidine dehydrogenase PreA subunit